MLGVENENESSVGRDGGVSLSGTSSPPSLSFAETGMRQLGVAARSSSPAKRSASEREDDDGASQDGLEAELGPYSSSPRSPKKSFLHHVSPMPNRFKSPTGPNVNQAPSAADMMDEDAASDSSYQPSLHPAVLQPDNGSQVDSTTKPPSAILTEGDTSISASAADAGIPSYDEQMSTILSLVQDGTTIRSGSKGFVISQKWIARVQSRTTKGSHDGHNKSAREGDVGPVDNSDIVLNDHVYGDLKDDLGDPFVPLRPEKTLQRDFEIVPEQAWNLIMQWYGLAPGSNIVTRYARTTTDPGASSENLQYELFPPICTIQRLKNNQENSNSASQESDIPAMSLVASRTEGFQKFLKRAKDAVGIDMATKVRVWKLLETGKTYDGRSGIPTPASSRSVSPAPLVPVPKAMPKLFIGYRSFSLLEDGTQREKLEIKDETANENYNGSLTLDTIGFPPYQTLVLEEQTGDPGADEFSSDRSSNALPRNSTDPLMLIPNGARASQDSTRLGANTGQTRRSPTPGIMTRGRVGNKGKARGCTGLVNLGNTCYMNSALQCIRSVEELSTYFLEGKSHNEINANNPLGHGGQIAKAYEELVRRIFTVNSSFSPQDFRRTLGRCQPLFSGYGQQDSQEFLSFLVDGLHEDLNRVLKKPYMENPESDDSTVHDPEAIKALGETFRSNYKARNDSVAMDLFNGFYKNTMICPNCRKISITFDPYSLLTLQLPIAQTFQHTIVFAPLHSSPFLVEVDMDKNSTIRGLKDYIGTRVGVPGECLVMAEMYSGKFYKIFEDADGLAEANIQPADKLLLCELDQAPTNWPPFESAKTKTNHFTLGSFSTHTQIPDMASAAADRMAIPLVHRISGTRGLTFDLCPSFVLITKEEARDADKVLRKVLQRVNTMTTRDIFDELEDDLAEGPLNREESDTVVMEDIDTSSSDDQKVQARSIESEDGLVDISMADAETLNRDVGSTSRSRKLNSSKILDPNFYIQPEWRRLFDMKIYTSSSEPIPCGWSSLNENTRLPQLESRQMPSSQSSSRRQSNASWVGPTQNDRSPESSEEEDELTKPDLNHHVQPKGVRSYSSDSESDTNFQDSTQSSNSSRNRVRLGPKKLGALPSLTKSKWKKTKENPESDFVIRLGEGLVLDWSDYGMEQLFEKADRTFENMETLPDPDLESKKAKRAARKKQGISLEECFEETAKSEVLSEDNAWYCGRCKELRRATKKLEIWTVPDILVLHLKRFSTNSRLRDKIDVLVDFPVEGLDLEGKVGLPEGKSLQYDLFAVDNHYGGLGGGHYTAYAQNFVDKKWYDYNDQMVSATSPSSVVTRAAYLLFYRRRSDKPLGGKLLEDVVHAAWSASESSTLSGEDMGLDDSLSNESSNVCLGPGAEANHQQGARNLLGSAGGPSDLEKQVQNDPSGNLPPAYSSTEFDEGIGMDEDPDNVLPGLEDQQRSIIGPQVPTWNWGKIEEGVNAPPGSSNGNSAPGSDRPEAGDVLEERLAEDFGDELGDNNEDNYLGHVSMRAPEQDDDDGEVAEIKISSDNEDGS